MRTQEEVEKTARDEIARKRAELLRVQQELNRKLKHADRRKNKRKKVNKEEPKEENKEHTEQKVRDFQKRV